MDRGTPIGKGGQKAQRPTEASAAFPLRIHPTVVSATGEEDGNLSGPIIVSRLALARRRKFNFIGCTPTYTPHRGHAGAAAISGVP